MIKTRKSLGQHWLEDRASLESIVAAARLSTKDVVLEVGPGPGSLTKLLAQNAKRVIAVELDERLATKLAAHVNADNLEVKQADILKFNLGELPPDYKVVANIPYYLTGHLLRIFASAQNPPKTMVLLVQKEVAARIAARPGKMSILAVSLQLLYEPELGRVVPAELFSPPPKVDSQVVILNRRTQPLFKNYDYKNYMQVVKAGFSSPRKKLRSSLAAGLSWPKEQVDKLLKEAEVNGDLRAEKLSLKQWHDIYVRFIVRSDLRTLL